MYEPVPKWGMIVFYILLVPLVIWFGYMWLVAIPAQQKIIDDYEKEQVQR